MVEIPDADKCCFCLPLRRGLLGVGYFKLASGVGILSFMIFFTMLLAYYRIIENFILTYIVFLFLILILGITFDIMFIVSAHRKNHKYLRIYNWYLVAELISYVILLLIFFIGMSIAIEPPNGIWIFVFGGTGIILVIMALHIYFMYLVRSETRKLQVSTLFSFKNHVDEPECSAEIFS